MSKSVLKTIRGKFLMIQKINNTLKLCAEEVQNEEEKAPLVHIETNEEQQKAYKFHYNKNWYWVKAVERSLEVVKDGDTNAGPFWFERKDLHSEQFSLTFKHHSEELYLSTMSQDGIDILTTTENASACLVITHEERE